MLYLPAEFPQDPEVAYLNHAAVAPWPRRTAEAVQQFAFDNMQTGAEGYLSWMEREAELRQRLAWLINAPNSEDIALVKNTSEGLSFVAAGIDWNAGDEIIGIADDFPSNRVVWESLTDQGVTFNPISTNAFDDPESALIDAITSNTRLMAISSVHFATGVRLDLQRLSQACRDKQVLLCVDAIQSLGAIAFDVQATPADFIVADGHKWMLGPEGLGIFYVNPAIRNSLKLTQYGWAMRAKPGDYSTAAWTVADSAKRFECGSPNMLGIHALNASISLLQELGFETIENLLRDNMSKLREALLSLPGCSVRTPETRDRQAGIMAFEIQGQDSATLYSQLMKQRVICANRGGYVRFSPHFYTRLETIERATDTLKHLIQ